MTDPDPYARRTNGDPVRYHPLANTIANIVTAVCAVFIAVKIYIEQ